MDPLILVFVLTFLYILFFLSSSIYTFICTSTRHQEIFFLNLEKRIKRDAIFLLFFMNRCHVHKILCNICKKKKHTAGRGGGGGGGGKGT